MVFPYHKYVEKYSHGVSLSHAGCAFNFRKKHSSVSIYFASQASLQLLLSIDRVVPSRDGMSDTTSHGRSIYAGTS